MGRPIERHDCECGAEYWATVEHGCDRCAYLDGATQGIGRVISTLRVQGTASSAELAAELKCTRSNIEYRCRSLLEKGRVSRRRVDDAGGFSSPSGIEWQYTLTVPR